MNELLLKRKFESFLPMQTVMRQWSDRRKKVEIPLFNSYIFVSIEEHAIQDILQIPGVAWNIRSGGKPAVLHNKELEVIRRFIETGLLIETFGNTDKLSLGDVVEVMDGPLRGAVGKLLDYHNKQQFSMLIDSIDQVITAHIDPGLLRRVTK